VNVIEPGRIVALSAGGKVGAAIALDAESAVVAMTAAATVNLRNLSMSLP
jgi:hypothetical protein